jgi:hypothetical protein
LRGSGARRVTARICEFCGCSGQRGFHDEAQRRRQPRVGRERVENRVQLAQRLVDDARSGGWRLGQLIGRKELEPPAPSP